jgi:hypothetical protein
VNDHLLQRITDALDAVDLSSWEVDFLESLLLQARTGKIPSDRQMDKLEEIEERER